MNDELFEQRLRRSYRAAAGTEPAPDDLRDSVFDIPDRAPVTVRPLFRRNWTLMAAAAVITVVSLVGALAAGSAITHLRSTATPTPSAPAAIVQPTPTPTPPPTPTAQPTASPSPDVVPGSLIAVYHSLGDTAEILTLDPVTGKQTVLGSMPAAFEPSDPNVFADTYGPGAVDVHWSTDGRRITVVRDMDGEYPMAQFDVATGTKSDISLREEAYVSPDGSLFAYVGNEPTAVVVEDLNGNLEHQLELPAMNYFGALSWALDGSAVIATGFTLPTTALSTSGNPSEQVFADTATGPGWALIVPINGGPISKFGGTPRVQMNRGQMSADSSTIVVERYCQVDATASCGGLTVIDVASGVLTQLTSNPNDLYGNWSPDGRQVAFERWSGGAARGVWVVNADGSGMTQLTTTDRRHRDHDVAWAPDGKSIAFTRSVITPGAGLLGDVYIVPSTGGDPELLISDAIADW